MKRRDASLPCLLETLSIQGHPLLSQTENKYSELLGFPILGFRAPLSKMGITRTASLPALEDERDFSEITEVKAFEHLFPELSEHLLPQALETS